MPVELQAKLLRVLQSGEVDAGRRRAQREQVDVRIVAATNRDLDADVREGRFREDLSTACAWSRSGSRRCASAARTSALLAEHFVAPLRRPSWRARPRYLRRRHARASRAHDWPGNVRELENAIKRALVLATGEVLTPEDFAFLPRAPAARPGAATCAGRRSRARSEALRAAGAGDLHRGSSSGSSRRCSRPCCAHTDGNQIRAAARARHQPQHPAQEDRRARDPPAGAALTPRPRPGRCRGLHVLADDDPRWRPTRWRRRAPPAPAAPRWCSCARSARATASRSPGRARSARSRARAGVLFFVNDRFDLALAAEADGVHLGQDDLPPARVSRRGPRAAAASAARPTRSSRCAPRAASRSTTSPSARSSARARRNRRGGPRGLALLAAVVRSVRPLPAGRDRRHRRQHAAQCARGRRGGRRGDLRRGGRRRARGRHARAGRRLARGGGRVSDAGLRAVSAAGLLLHDRARLGPLARSPPRAAGARSPGASASSSPSAPAARAARRPRLLRRR